MESSNIPMIEKDYKVCNLSFETRAVLKLYGYTITKWKITNKHNLSTIRYRIFYQGHAIGYLQDNHKWRAYYDQPTYHKNNIAKILGLHNANTYP